MHSALLGPSTCERVCMVKMYFGSCTHALHVLTRCMYTRVARESGLELAWCAILALCARDGAYTRCQGEVTVMADARGHNGSAMRRFCKRLRQATYRTAQQRAPYSSMVKTSSAPMWGTARRCWCQKLGISPRAKRWRRSTNLIKLPRLPESVLSAARSLCPPLFAFFFLCRCLFVVVVFLFCCCRPMFVSIAAAVRQVCVDPRRSACPSSAPCCAAFTAILFS
jgi:hypothetical protein